MFILVGLGNPGTEYEHTRHNTGRRLLEVFRKAHGFPEWETEKKIKALVSSGTIGTEKVNLVKLETFMNKSGTAVAPLIKNKKAAGHLVVVHDDLDIPFGSYKISFNKSSGGHKGVESVIKALKTQAFVRIRVGISPVSPFSTIFPILKRPYGAAAVEKYILGKFSSEELSVLKKTANRINDSLLCLITEGRERAVSKFN